MAFSSRLRRVASMPPSEIASRVKQVLAKRVDGLGLFLPSNNSFPADQLAKTGRFYFSRDEIPQRLHLIRQNIPGFEENVLEQVEKILSHQFPLLGYGPLDYGTEIDWQLDVVSGKRAPLKPWPRIDYLDFDEVGDSKVTWELNRHQFLVTLAKAWLLTGEEHFVRELERLYYDWHQMNPYPLGINWASSLEVAFRSLSWIWVRELLVGCELASQLRKRITQALAFNAWYIRRYLSTYFSPNTHLQGEAVALFFIGALCPALPNAASWRDAGWKILLEHAFAKVLGDGAYFEQSTYYHVYALDFFLHARVLAERNEMPFPGDFDDVLKKMLVHLAALCQVGPPPRLGDDDGGRVFDGRRNRAEHLRDPLAIGAALYGVNAFKQPGVQLTEEMLWLLGDEGLQAFSDYPDWNNSSSAKFPHTGLYVSHAGERSRSQVVLDAGPLGGGTGGHGHADALSLTLSLEGTPLLVDPGACCYAGPGDDRNSFRTTAMHNTVTVDGLSQAVPRTAFSWFRWPQVAVEAIVLTPEFDYIVASHDGYTRLQPPVMHRRTLFTSREGFWFVLDELISNGPHDYALHWHFAPGASVTLENGDRCTVDLERSRLHLLTIADGWLPTVESGPFSSAYGRKQTAPVIRYTKSAVGADAVPSVLWTGSFNAPASMTSVLSDLPTVRAYNLTSGDKHSFFFFGDGISGIDVGDWQSDARFLYGTLNEDRHPLRVICVGATIVRYGGEILHASQETQDRVVW